MKTLDLTGVSQDFKTRLAALVDRFEQQRAYYASADYTEAQARVDFIDPFFEALGWDVRNQAGLGPKEREVAVERGLTRGRPDYDFRRNGRTVFFVEAKPPHVPLERADVVMQAKSYAWNSRDVFVCVVTDFEEIRLYDATARPDRQQPEAGLIFAHRYTDYLKPEALDDLWLLSKEAVAAGSLDRLLDRSKITARQRVPVDRAFLDDLTRWREKLAKAVYKLRPGLTVADLNNVVQVFLDRLIFIRIAEDRRILPPQDLQNVVGAWRLSGKRRSLAGDLVALFREINARLNGEIFKPHLCEKIDWDSDPDLLTSLIHNLYPPASPYRFDVIGVELLGSIYERYLGKTIRITATRAVVEDRPAARKAGGVYYTPQYIVDYVVEQTVGQAIEGKTPQQIASLKILDPACGSGSFLLGAYQKLLDYHERYYARLYARRKRQPGQPHLLQDGDGGEFRLSLEQKAEILRNNIYGVDIDPQAVEITMMSLYIKLLEGERGLLANHAMLPPLRDNIKCGNALISHDIVHQPDLFAEGELGPDELERINPFDWGSQREGFGEIMAAGGFDVVIGNPPYNAALSAVEEAYLQQNFDSVRAGRQDTAAVFVEAGLRLSKGPVMYLLPYRLVSRKRNHGPFQQWLYHNCHIQQLVYLGKISEIGANDEFMLLQVKKARGRRGLLMRVAARAPKEAIEKRAIEFSEIDQGKWGPPAYEMNIRLGQFDQALLAKIESVSIRLGEIAESRDGIVPFIRDKLVSDHKKDKRYKPLLGIRGLYSLDRYSYSWGGAWICYDLEEAKKHIKAKSELRKVQLRDETIFLRPEKILTAQDSVTIKGTLDTDRFYTTNSIHATFLKDNVQGYDIRYILALMNSRLLNYYHQSLALKGQDLHPQILVTNLARLPIRAINFSNPADVARHDRLVLLVKRMLELHRQKQTSAGEAARARLEREINVTDEQIDALVYELYGLSREEIRTVEASNT